jgi:hypothetical protein
MATTTSAAAPLEDIDLPFVQVSTTSNGFVLLKWGEAQSTTVTLSTVYSDHPYSFHATTNSNGDEPFIKTYGSLLSCSGGILTIGTTRYRIQVEEQQQQREKEREREDRQQQQQHSTGKLS